MREFIGVLLAVMDEHRHKIAALVIWILCIAAVWVMLLVWTQ